MGDTFAYNERANAAVTCGRPSVPALALVAPNSATFARNFPPHLWTYQVRPTYFDLWALSRDQLASAGLKPERLEIAGLCTRCRGDEFFSYRREGLTGRQGAVIAFRPQ